MKTDTKNLVSITDANQNFSQVAKRVEQNGNVIILKNNKPQYVVSKFDENKFYDYHKYIIFLLAHIKFIKLCWKIRN